ncbi:septum formation initiator family protein [Microlunatus elymi]|uniref:Septum formation initiator family protein n=1 Tax=Microlunatus elymi TaxID=2596828 RepID=A0A516Q6B1_9ACTN|nr:septum formation initiator family protein [Microlunatus elymi]
MAVVLLILTISYASSLRAYFNQRQDIAATKQEITTSQQKIGELSDEISRWNDPNYVRTQARERLGWVMPGERGFRVVDADGKPVSGENEITGAQPASKPATAWYSKLWGSVEAADKPTVPKKAEQPSAEPTITEKTKHR